VPPPPPPNGFHVPAGACGARERDEAGAWRRLARRGARREGGGPPAEGSAPGGARPSPRPGFAMGAAAAAGRSGPLGFWRGGSGATAGGIPRCGGAAGASGRVGNGAWWAGACDRLISGRAEERRAGGCLGKAVWLGEFGIWYWAFLASGLTAVCLRRCRFLNSDTGMWQIEQLEIKSSVSNGIPCCTLIYVCMKASISTIFYQI
jgi:hypothetical protein